MSNIDSDYEYSRQTYYNLIDKGNQSLEQMIEVARESEHPRAYEVLSSMLKNIADINGKLMELNKKKADIENQTKKEALPNKVTNNNLFVGSTSELQRMIYNMSEDKKVIDADESTK